MALIGCFIRVSRMVRAGLLDEQVATQSGSLSAREARAELASSGIRAALQTLKCSRNKAPVRRTGSAVLQGSVNVGGLKSQVKIVNGIRVPSNRAKFVSNKPVLVCVDEEPTDENNQPPSMQTSSSRFPKTTTTTSKTSGSLSILQLPTAQPINTLGSSGSENQVPSIGAISSRGATTNRTFGRQC